MKSAISPCDRSTMVDPPDLLLIESDAGLLVTVPTEEWQWTPSWGGARSTGLYTPALVGGWTFVPNIIISRFDHTQPGMWGEGPDALGTHVRVLAESVRPGPAGALVDERVSASIISGGDVMLNLTTWLWSRQGARDAQVSGTVLASQGRPVLEAVWRQVRAVHVGREG